MSSTRFLSNDSLWSELHARVKGARAVRAAVAFMGRGGADLLPLKKGDTLVVNLGIQTVKQGLTSPREIRRLIRRGVRVFTRSTLHAKFFLCDRALVVGSANVSNNSQRVLDEAACLTTDPSALRRAANYFDKLCTEPVRPEYLKLCLQAYRPPIFDARSAPRVNARSQRIIEAKLWFISGLSYRDLPEVETKSAEQIEKRAAKELRKAKGTRVDFTHYPRKPVYFSHIRAGDWIVLCIADSGSKRFVHAPQQVLGMESYPRGDGKKRYLLLSEAPDNGQEITLAQFRPRVRRLVPKLDTERPRTMAIESIESADAILKFWTAGGRVAKPDNRRGGAKRK